MLKKIKLHGVNKTETFPYEGIVHDLEIKDAHSYNVNGIIVHNSACITRKVAGVGYPQLSATIECADAAHGLGGYVCSDGGCTVPGDISKAFGAGGDFVMLGGMLSCASDIGESYVENDGTTRKIFYGMSSSTAMRRYSGGVAGYRASEGKLVSVEAEESLDEIMQNILGGIRSSMTYIGATKLKEIPKRTTFIRVNRQLNTVYGDS